MDSNLEVPRRALAVGAHPDDIEFGCGATLAKWAAAGCAISLLVCTDGSKGTWDPESDAAGLVVTRQREQRAAARALDSAAQVVLLSWPDGELEAGLRQRWEIAAWIRRIKPDVMLGHDPWKRYRIHPDHRNAGWLVTDGIVAARDPLFFPELDAPPHRPSSLLLFEADEVNHVEDATGFGTAKAAALLEHRSQFRSTMGISTPVPDPEHPEVADFRRRLDDELSEHGALAGFADGEAFHRIDDL
ncbi:MAG: PIG-L family deacetylase [Acidimicrobiales bacterium]|jgi:LmbE family N-acetylglucosaminyl deacetylase